jgi:hypothetical protein
MPASIKTWWRDWIETYDTSKEVPFDNRMMDPDTGRDPKWHNRQGLVNNMFVMPQLIANFISRGLLHKDRYDRHAEAVNELHHNMRNALYEAGQDDAAHCV